jgi:hypothetical protein
LQIFQGNGDGTRETTVPNFSRERIDGERLRVVLPGAVQGESDVLAQKETGGCGEFVSAKL